MTTRQAAPRRTPHDWAAAGLLALAEGGLSAVAVEPVAARLGATKGSFYWHFADRAALVDAVLALWERVETEDVITQLAAVPDPGERFHLLFTLTFATPGAGAVDAALLAQATHPQVAPVLERVTRRRLDFMTASLVEAGVPADAAADRSLTAYVEWIGLQQLARALPQVLPAGAERDRFIRSVLERLETLLTV